MSSTQEVGEIFGSGSGPANAMLRSPTVLIAAIGLWGMNLYFFRLFGIDYVKVLKHDLYKLAKEELDRHQNYQANNSSATNNNTKLSSYDNNSNKDDDLSNPQDDNDDGCNLSSSSNNSTDVRTSLVNNEYPERVIDSSRDVNVSINGKSKNTFSTTRANSFNGHSGSMSGIQGNHHGAGSSSITIPASTTAIFQEFYLEDDEIYNINNGNISDDAEASIMESGSNSSMEKTLVPTIYNNQAVTWGRLCGLSISLLFLLHSTYFIWFKLYGNDTIWAIFCFYGVVTTFILIPLRSTDWLRKSAKIVLARTFELITLRCWCFRISEQTIKQPNGPRAIPFVDVFFADAMCSLSKVFFDWGMLLHMAYYYPRHVPKSVNSVLIPFAFASIPFFIRARQCLVMYEVTKLKNDPHRFSHLWNALKYSTSIFPLLLSVYQKTAPTERPELERYLIVLLIINATYSLYWDIVMDWGMMQNPSAVASVACCGTKPPVRLDQPRSLTCWHMLLRQRLRFGVAMSLVILFTDSILRFSWTLRYFFQTTDGFVLCTQFLEIFRRAIWNLLRVDWENLKQSGSHATLASSLSSNSATTMLNTMSRQHIHHSSTIEFASLVAASNGAVGSSGGGNKDDDEKSRLLLQRANMHVVASTKVKP